MKWFAFGCSNSSPTWGIPWPFHLTNIGEPELSAYTQGGANEMSLLKLIMSTQQKPELIVWQLTEPSRLMIGIDGYRCHDEPISEYAAWHSPWQFHGQHYNMNVRVNKEHFVRLFGKSYAEADELFVKHQSLSTLNLHIKPPQTILMGQLLCKQLGIKLLAFRWWDFPTHSNPLVDYLKHLIDWDDIMSDSVWQWLQKNKGDAWINAHNVEGYHLDSEAHKLIADELLIPFIESRLKCSVAGGKV